MALIELSPQAVAIFIAFIMIILIFYKLFNVAVKLVVVTLIAFAFPWIVEYLSLPIPVTASIDNGLQFAILGAVIFLAFTFFKTIMKIIKKITGH